MNEIQSTMTPSLSIPAAPKPLFCDDKNDKMPETPMLDRKFNLDALRKKCGIPINKNKKNIDSNSNSMSMLNDSLGSIPCLSSYKMPLNEYNEDQQQKENKSDDDMNGDGTGKDGMSYLTENEFNGVPKWISSQLGSVSQINKTIDIVNNALKAKNGRIGKSEFKELIGANETPFILLLTRTNRLRTDWCQGNSVYSLK